MKKVGNHIIKLNDVLLDIELCCAYCHYLNLHFGHKVLPINDELSLKKENISIENSINEFNDYIQKINELKNKIENEIIKIDKLYEKVNNETKKYFELKHEKLIKEENDLKEKLQIEVTKVKEKLEKNLSESNKLIKINEKINKGIKSLEKEGNNMLKTLSYISNINKNEKEMKILLHTLMKNVKINFIAEEQTIKYEVYFFNELELRGFTNEIVKTAKEANQILNWIDKSPSNYLKVEKLYTATLEENTCRDFHNKCDGKGSTIVLCEELNDGYRFGGYAKEEWDLSRKRKIDNSSFLFSLDKNKKYTGREDRYIYGGVNHGPHFGYANLGLIWSCNNISKADAFIGNNSHHFQNMDNGVYFDVPKNELCGKKEFQLRKMEVYKVIEEKII